MDGKEVVGYVKEREISQAITPSEIGRRIISDLIELYMEQEIRWLIGLEKDVFLLMEN
jgi:hypothetical protein